MIQLPEENLYLTIVETKQWQVLSWKMNKYGMQTNESVTLDHQILML